uniref:NADH-ubiquinone oxidoreductase chain 2 n=1 Tax=Peripatoides sp. DVL-2010 TaxID=867919 RepID=F8RJ86_9BILA|nr:NADH dehydrogenase subunit 2 [Peripatoides sp. DVL-2010]
MMFHSYQLLFLMILFLSILFQISSSSWFSIWMSMEMNLMTFIPFLSSSENQLYNEGSMKYFIIQAFGSVMLLIGWMISSFMIFSSFYFKSMSYVMLLLALFLKMGAAPFHFWFPSLVNNLSWFSLFMLMTWQKLSPLIMLMYINQWMILISLSSGVSALIGGIGGLNQISLRKIFAYSSIGHIGWLMMCMILSEIIFMFYISFYFFMMMLFCLIFYMNFISTLVQFFCYKSFFLEKIIIMISLFSLGGLPPLSGFFPKWMLLNELLLMKMWMLSLILLLSSLMNLYYYTRIGYSLMMFSSMIFNLFLFKPKFLNKVLIYFVLYLMLISMIYIPMGMWLM